ncbi:hypothetical protein ACA910_011457 [Epithemia clementina (nom. ined.)]
MGTVAYDEDILKKYNALELTNDDREWMNWVQEHGGTIEFCCRIAPEQAGGDVAIVWDDGNGDEFEDDKYDWEQYSTNVAEDNDENTANGTH